MVVRLFVDFKKTAAHWAADELIPIRSGLKQRKHLSLKMKTPPTCEAGKMLFVITFIFLMFLFFRGDSHAQINVPLNPLQDVITQVGQVLSEGVLARKNETLDDDLNNESNSGPGKRDERKEEVGGDNSGPGSKESPNEKKEDAQQNENLKENENGERKKKEDKREKDEEDRDTRKKDEEKQEVLGTEQKQEPSPTKKPIKSSASIPQKPSFPKLIQPPFSFLFHSLPKEFYKVSGLSKDVTVALLSSSLILLAIGVLTLRSRVVQEGIVKLLNKMKTALFG